MNKLGIPSKGTSFCRHCFQFEEMQVSVTETEKDVIVKMTCGCGEETIEQAPKNTFFEYDQQHEPGMLPAAAGENFKWETFKQLSF